MKKDRIEKAIGFAVRYGGIDGDHHKAWVIDQMIRALTGCPVLRDEEHNEYQGESEEYLELVSDAKAGKDGPDTYSWDTGITP